MSNTISNAISNTISYTILLSNIRLTGARHHGDSAAAPFGLNELGATEEGVPALLRLRAVPALTGRQGRLQHRDTFTWTRWRGGRGERGRRQLNTIAQFHLPSQSKQWVQLGAIKLMSQPLTCGRPS